MIIDYAKDNIYQHQMYWGLDFVLVWSGSAPRFRELRSFTGRDISDDTANRNLSDDSDEWRKLS